MEEEKRKSEEWKYLIFVSGLLIFASSFFASEGSFQQIASLGMGIFLTIVGVYAFFKCS